MAAAVAQLKMAASLVGEDSLNRLLLLQLLLRQAVGGAVCGLAAGQWQVQLSQAQALASKPVLEVADDRGAHVGSALPQRVNSEPSCRVNGGACAAAGLGS